MFQYSHRPFNGPSLTLLPPPGRPRRPSYKQQHTDSETTVVLTPPSHSGSLNDDGGELELLEKLPTVDHERFGTIEEGYRFGTTPPQDGVIGIAFGEPPSSSSMRPRTSSSPPG